MAGEVVANIKDSATLLNVPVDGIATIVLPPAPVAGQAIRQTVVLAKADGTANYADADGLGNLQVSVKNVAPVFITGDPSGAFAGQDVLEQLIDTKSGPSPALAVIVQNPVPPAFSRSASLSQVAAATSSIILLAANWARKGIIITNTGSGILYLAYGPTATSTAFTYIIAPGQTLEPQVNYQGLMTGIWSATGGFAVISEMI